MYVVYCERCGAEEKLYVNEWCVNCYNEARGRLSAVAVDLYDQLLDSSDQSVSDSVEGLQITVSRGGKKI